MPAKSPTPQGISALLRKAGFERSNHGDPGVMWNEHSTGYRAYGGKAEAGHLFVTVIHYDEDQHCCEDCYARHLDKAIEMLSRYAETVYTAGFDADLKRDADPRLFVMAKEG